MDIQILQINNSHNNEEEEDLQDKIRIQAELQDLLTENLNEFRYDDGESTVNSSTNISVASISAQDIHDKYTDKYKNAVTPDEQLKVLYEVRMRELTTLQHEYDTFKNDKNKELNLLKNQLLLHEGEIRQLHLAKKNCEDILVEKTEEIKELKLFLDEKNGMIKDLKQKLKECETDLNAYRTEVAELQIKIQTEYGPFNKNAKYNSEELHKSLQERINQLENILDEEIKKSKSFEKERDALKEEINCLLQERDELRSDNIKVISNFDEAQQQCKDLIDIIEMAKRENNHLKSVLERDHYINLELSKSETMDSELLLNHNEKLRRMLLDKSIENDTLQTKLKYFEESQKDLLIYRQLQNDVYKKEFQSCNNPSHTKDLLLMQNDLQNYRRTIDDKNQQILNLNTINKDLQEKIEEMILQTRSEIQNISHKYSLPQLKEMTDELEKAEATIKELNEKLKKSEERRQSLVLKFKNNENDSLLNQLENCEMELKETKKLLDIEKENNIKIAMELKTCHKEIEKLKDQKRSPRTRKSLKESDKSLREEYDQLKIQLNHVMKHLEQNKQDSSAEIVDNVKTQMEDFLKGIQDDSIEKGILESKIIEWKKLLNDIKEDEHLKKQYREAVINLKDLQEKLKQSEEQIQDLNNGITILEGEKCSLSFELAKCQKDLEESQKICNELQFKTSNLEKLIQEKYEVAQKIQSTQENSEKLLKEIEVLKKELTTKETNLKLSEEGKQEINTLLQKMNSELNKLGAENLKLETELKEVQAGIMKKNLEKELKNAENDIERSRTDESFSENELFKKRLNAELMKAELKLRDELQLEYQKRVSEIEKKYQESCRDINALCKQQTEQLEHQEKKYKEYLKAVMKECAEQAKILENQKAEAIKQLDLWKEEFLGHKQDMVVAENKYKAMVKKMEIESNKHISEWKNWSKHMVSSCLGIDEMNKKVREKILKDMKSYNAEVAKIEKTYNDKIKRKVKSMT